MRKTNPIRPGRRASAQNEPNLARPAEEVGRACHAAALRAEATPDQVGGRLCEEPKRAKRTQFRAGGWCPGRIVQNKPNLARAPGNGRGPAGPVPRRSVIVQNEANFEVPGFRVEVSSVKLERSSQACSDFKLHTSNFKLPKKPLTASLRTGAIVPNRAKSRAAGVQNEANLGRAQMVLTGSEERSYRERVLIGRVPKQSQFGPETHRRGRSGKCLSSRGPAV
jgi:hypothetical protein